MTWIFAYFKEKKASFNSLISKGWDSMLVSTLVIQESIDLYVFGILLARSVPMFVKNVLNWSAIFCYIENVSSVDSTFS